MPNKVSLDTPLDTVQSSHSVALAELARISDDLVREAVAVEAQAIAVLCGELAGVLEQMRVVNGALEMLQDAERGRV